MNTKSFAFALIAAASLASVNAFAAGADGGLDTPQISHVSSVSRADTRAETHAGRQGPVTASSQVDGGIAVTTAGVAGVRNRADVRAEAVQTRSGNADSAPGRA